MTQSSTRKLKWKVGTVQRGYIYWKIFSFGPSIFFPDDETFPAWKVPVFRVFLFRIFPHSVWVRRGTKYLSVFSPNAGKYGLEKLRIRTPFTQGFCQWSATDPIDIYLFKVTMEAPEWCVKSVHSSQWRL